MNNYSRNFHALYGILHEQDLLKKGTRPPSLDNLPAAIKKGAQLLPMPFIDAYAVPLENRLSAVESWVKARRLAPTIFEAMTAAVYQLDNDALRPDLHRFLAVISNLYRSFLSSTKREAVNVPIVQQLPPLAAWLSTADSGPFTVPIDMAYRVLGAHVGVVSMPAGFAGHPFLYTCLTHEVGGHDVVHADLDLLPELSRKVHRLFNGRDAWQGVLWDYWMDEASSDVYGLLNMGPMYATSLAAFTSVFLGTPKQKKPMLRTTSDANDNGTLDIHPTDVLRLALAKGVIESMSDLSLARKEAHVAQIDALLNEAIAGHKAIEITGIARDYSGKMMEFDGKTYDMEYMLSSAAKVGQWLATTRLQALDGKSIQDIETWDDADEDAADAISAKLLENRSVVGAGDDAQLLAGLCMALMKQPDHATYTAATALINDTLDDSFHKDPYWGVVPVDRWVMAPRRRRQEEERSL